MGGANVNGKDISSCRSVSIPERIPGEDRAGRLVDIYRRGLPAPARGARHVFYLYIGGSCTPVFGFTNVAALSKQILAYIRE